MRKLFIILTFLISLLLLGAPVIHAQEATATPDAGWQVIEQCIGKPTKPPQGWHYDGTILMTGYAGIHGVNAKWDTPRVMVSGSPYTFRDGIADGSAGLSPDKKWYATFDSEFIYSETYNHLVLINAIEVYSTSNPKEIYRVSWKNSWLYMWGPRRMLWLDNSHLIYETSEYAEQKPGQLYVVNPFDDTKIVWTGKTDLAYFSGYPSATEIIYSDQYPSPNLKWTLKREKEWGLYEVMSGSLITKVDIDASPFAIWSDDSSEFITEVLDSKDDSLRDLALFTQDGVLDSVMMKVQSESLNTKNASWSPNGQFFSYLVESYEPKHSLKLFIADIRNKHIIDTCINVGKGIAWSPDGLKLAIFLPSREQSPVAILDLETNSLHIVGYHIANDQDYILGWRAD